MLSTNFVALTGHLNEYPLGDLISILRRGRKTGRLLIEYQVGPCSFYFLEGNLIDSQLNSLVGMQAVLLALSQPNASFNFNPLIQPPRKSINGLSQKIILELLGCPEEREINIEASHENGKEGPLASSPYFTATPVDLYREELPGQKELLALPPKPLEHETRSRNRRVLITSAIIALLISFLTVAALTLWFIKRVLPTALSEAGKTETSAGILGEGAGANVQVVKVRMRIEQGRVTQASVEDHHPGMEAYEAMALRVARALHYAPTASGQETVLIRINSHG